jgi:hypothetical protein
MKLGLDEFALFCEEICYKGKEIAYIEERLRGFLAVVDRREAQRQGMWQHRAHCVDVIARWTIPPGFIGFLIALFQMGEENLLGLANNKWETVFYLSGLLPMIATCVAMVFLGISRCKCHHGNRQEGNAQPRGATTGTSGVHQHRSPTPPVILRNVSQTGTITLPARDDDRHEASC